jgi:hypothetical protein
MSKAKGKQQKGREENLKSEKLNVAVERVR